jgi:DNA-binding NarL/FixJ family response regulator
MPTTERKLRVFLCHASQDKPIVRELYQRLLAEIWIDPWLDEEKLLLGQNWELEIEKAVETTDSVIVCVSTNSVNKEGFIQKEIRKVLDISEQKPDGVIFIIPIRLNDCQPPVRLRAFQYADYFPGEQKSKTYQKILKSLEMRHGTLQPIIPHRDILSSDDKAFARLSRQEKIVLLLLTEGKTNREIAITMFLGEGTVRNYVKSNLSKLGLSNRAELAAYAVQHSLREIIRTI